MPEPPAPPAAPPAPPATPPPGAPPAPPPGTPPAPPPGTPPGAPPAPPAANPYPPTDWRHSVFPGISGDEKALKVLDKFKDQAAFVKSHAELESFQGTSVRIPKDDAKPEEWTAFFGKLGRPASPREYKFERPKLPEGISIDPEVESMILNAAFEAGNSGKQVEAFMKVAANQAVAAHERARSDRAKAQVALQGKWGDQYDKRVALAKSAISYHPPEIVEAFNSLKLADGTLLGNHPVIMELLYSDGYVKQESGYIVAEVDGIRTADAAAAEVKKLMSDPAYFDKSKPEHAEIVAKVNKLQQLRFPGAPQNA